MNALRKTALAALLIGCAITAGTGHAQISFRAAASASVGASTTITHVAAGADATSGGCPSLIAPAIPAGVNGDLLIALVATINTDQYTAIVCNQPLTASPKCPNASPAWVGARGTEAWFSFGGPFCDFLDASVAPD